MRLVCPNCDAKYEVSDDAVPQEGRDVQCSSCGHAWFQRRPEDEIAAEEEAALFGDDLAAELADEAAPDLSAPDLAVDETAEAAAPDSTDEAIAAALGASVAGHAFDAAPEFTDLPPKQELDDSVLNVLREEAAREAEARRLDAQKAGSRQAEADGQMQTQPDLGVEAAGAGLTPTQRRLAMLKGEDPDAAPPEPPRPAARRDLLPDVEEINSTLSPSETGADLDAEVDALPDLTKQRRGFRSGFFLMMLLAVIAAAIYMAAPKLSAQFPALESTLTNYVANVDSLRLWLNNLMKSATHSLNGG